MPQSEESVQCEDDLKKENALLGLLTVGHGRNNKKKACDLDTDSKENEFMLSREKKSHID